MKNKILSNNKSLCIKESEVVEMDKYKGKDKIAGKPIRLNRKKLMIKQSKDYAEVVFFGDLHFGARECDIERAKRMLEYCEIHRIYLFLMGDLMEASTRYSVGSGVYEQLSPQKQLDFIIDLLKPLADEGLILGTLSGNHENRIYKETGINVMKIIANVLKIPFLGDACWNLFYVGKESYIVYTLHGASGSRYVYTKLKSVVDIAHSFNAELMVMGHVHDLADVALTMQTVDRKRKMVTEFKKHILISGHYLKYDRSYAQMKGLPIGKEGSPKVKFYSEKHDIHISY